jgi:hypothetical protein
LQTRAKHEAGKVLNTLRRRAKSKQLPSFVKWLDETLSTEIRNSFTVAIAEVAEPVAIVNGMNPASLCGALANSFISTIQDEMRVVALDNQETELARMAISDSCDLIETNYTASMVQIVKDFTNGTT